MKVNSIYYDASLPIEVTIQRLVPRYPALPYNVQTKTY